jgi:UDP-glucose 4-epimerase
VLITGASGYIGRQLVAKLAAVRPGFTALVASDLREVPAEERLSGVTYVTGDIRSQDLEQLMRTHGVEAVVHLAAIVTPGRDSNRQLEYEVDVLGTRRVLEACVAAGVRQLVVTSSGAAYGYHADNAVPLHEDHPLRGNPEFAYADHKRQVEELLAASREAHPQLDQLIFRPGAILGDSVSNQITDLFEKPVVLGVAGSDAPFTFVWDEDVVACLVKGVLEGSAGIYNLAGDGATPMRRIARETGRPYLPLPALLIRGALALLRPLGLSQYGPEQVDFLRYRPVLANDRLKGEFGYQPQRSSDEVFSFYWGARRHGA